MVEEGHTESKVEQMTVLVKALTALLAATKGSFLPVLLSVLFTQGGAAIFMQGHVDQALKTEVAPTKQRTEKLQHKTELAYAELADVVNEHGRILHDKTGSAETTRLRRVIIEQRKEIQDTLAMLEALRTVVTAQHGERPLQRALDSIERVETVEDASEVADVPVPMLPTKFKAFDDESAEGAPR
jgi:hypothetical protein